MDEPIGAGKSAQWFSAKPLYGHVIDTRRPVEDSVMNAVRWSVPPKQILVVNMSSVAMKSRSEPSGAMTVIPVHKGGNAHVPVTIDGERIK